LLNVEKLRLGLARWAGSSADETRGEGGFGHFDTRAALEALNDASSITQDAELTQHVSS
jgi:hypothetical protein